MRIGIDITPVIYQGSGICTYTRLLVTHLLKLKNSAHHFTLFASTLRGQKLLWQYLDTLKSFDNFSVKILPVPPLATEVVWNKFHALPIDRLVKNLDLFHAWDWQQPPKGKLKIITTIHDLTPLKFSSSHHQKTITVQKRRLNHVVAEADAIICDSNATRDDVIKLLKLDPQKLHTVYLAAGSEFSPIPNRQVQQIQQKYKLNKYILSVGTQEPRKNLKNTIKAFEILNEPDYTLVIAGKFGWGEKAKPQANIKVLGFVPQSDLPALFAGAQCFVYPSLYEGFGLPVLEAMSCGCPVVTSDKGSLKEIAENAAILVNPQKPQSIAAAIKTAISSSEQLTKLGFKQAQKFSWEKTARATLKVYKDIC